MIYFILPKENIVRKAYDFLQRKVLILKERYDIMSLVMRTVLCPVYVPVPFGSGAGTRTSIREGGTYHE